MAWATMAKVVRDVCREVVHSREDTKRLQEKKNDRVRLCFNFRHQTRKKTLVNSMLQSFRKLEGSPYLLDKGQSRAFARGGKTS